MVEPVDTDGAGQTLAGFVRRAQRRASFASSLRALAVASLAAAVTAAAIEFDGGDALQARAVVALLLSASCAAASWLREQRTGEHEFTRELDRRLELDGALATGHQTRGASGLAALLAQRTLSRLGPDALRRAAPAPNLGWLAAPLAGLALWLAAERASAPRAPELAQLASAVAATLSAGGELDPARASSVRAAAAQLAERAARADADTAELVREARALAAQVNELAHGLPADSERALELLASAQRLEALVPRGPGPGPGSDARSRAAAQGGDGAGGRSPALQSEPGERTMKGSTAQGAGPSTPLDERSLLRPSAGAPSGDSFRSQSVREAPLLAGRWWSEDYDAVVAAWREAR